MTTETGGPAFPVPLNPGEIYQGHAPQDGMTLRDYFAAKAVSAASDLSDCHKDSMPAAIARNAYAIADAMLEARTK